MFGKQSSAFKNQVESAGHCTQDEVAIKDEVDSIGNTNNRVKGSDGESMLCDENNIAPNTIIGFVYDSDIG